LRNFGKTFVPQFNLENEMEIPSNLEKLGQKSLWECLGREKIGENRNK
jgi:hypothetical protein